MDWPRKINHGWWNCEDCRVNLHRANYRSILRGSDRDVLGEPYTVEYLQDFLEYLVEEELFESCAKVKLMIDKLLNEKENPDKELNKCLPKSRVY